MVRIHPNMIVLRDEEEIMLHKKVMHLEARMNKMQSREGKENVARKMEQVREQLHQLRVKNFVERKT